LSSFTDEETEAQRGNLCKGRQLVNGRAGIQTLDTRALTLISYCLSDPVMSRIITHVEVSRMGC
jgi:hypothetical protein